MMSPRHENTHIYADVLMVLVILTHKHIHQELNVHKVHTTASVGTGTEQRLVSEHVISP